MGEATPLEIYIYIYVYILIFFYKFTNFTNFLVTAFDFVTRVSNETYSLKIMKSRALTMVPE